MFPAYEACADPFVSALVPEGVAAGPENALSDTAAQRSCAIVSTRPSAATMPIPLYR